MMHPHPDIPSWRTKLAAMAARELELRLAGRWTLGPSDLLAVAGLSRRETVHSRVLRWLLDPTGEHGLGIKFLQKFAREVLGSAPAPELLVRATSENEVVADDCRADIVVEGRGWTLVVEVKVEALEGPAQCDRLRRAFGGRPGVGFVFLTPQGRAPISDSGELPAFRCLSFRRVRELLEASVAEVPESSCEGRATVHAYLITLREELG